MKSICSPFTHFHRPCIALFRRPMRSKASQSNVRQRTDQIDTFTPEMSCLSIVWAVMQDIRFHKRALCYLGPCRRKTSEPPAQRAGLKRRWFCVLSLPRSHHMAASLFSRTISAQTRTLCWSIRAAFWPLPLYLCLLPRSRYAQVNLACFFIVLCHRFSKPVTNQA